jgi:hypothetical protein
MNMESFRTAFSEESITTDIGGGFSGATLFPLPNDRCGYLAVKNAEGFILECGDFLTSTRRFFIASEPIGGNVLFLTADAAGNLSSCLAADFNFEIDKTEKCPEEIVVKATNGMMLKRYMYQYGQT